jgi:hypothetical protein
MLSETRTTVPTGSAGTVVDVVLVVGDGVVVVEGAGVVVVGDVTVVVLDAGADVVVVDPGPPGGRGDPAHPASTMTAVAPSAPTVRRPMRRCRVPTMCSADSFDPSGGHETIERARPTVCREATPCCSGSAACARACT